MYAEAIGRGDSVRLDALMRVATAVALLAALLLTPTTIRAQQAIRVSVSPRSVPDSVVGLDGRRQTAERVTLAILEHSPGIADTTRVEVVYLRLPARQPSTRSPIVFLMGGPGVPASAIARVPPYWSLFERLREVADVILLDQRGVGLSRPTMECPPGAPPASNLLESHRRLRDALRATYAPCVALWRSRGVQPELFSVGEIARDVEEIRRHLRVSRLSLLGFSYGTRLALEYVKLFPQHVDQVVLQGTLGFENVVRLPSTLDSLFDRVTAVAAADPVARTLVPNLRGALVEQFAALARRPIEVRVAGPTGDSVRLMVGREGLQSIVAGRLADARLPALAATLGTGDRRVLGALASAFYRDLAAGGGSLFGLAVYCSAPGPEERERLAHSQVATSALGEVFDNVITSRAFCRSIGITPGSPATPPAQVLDRPALFITGTLDDRTPPGNAESAARFFTRASVVTVENGVHELLPLDAVQALVMDFFTNGRVNQPRVQASPPRFLTVEEALQPPRRR